MTCERCGTACQGGLCRECEQIRLDEKLHGTSVETLDEWTIDQRGLGDAGPEGQATLDGALVRGDSDE